MTMDTGDVQSNQQQGHFPTSVDKLQGRDENEGLLMKVGYLESRLAHLASSNADLSCRLLQSEEEKLKISKELVEEKIQTTKSIEEFEKEIFELKNTISNQKTTITDLQRDQDKCVRKLLSAEARLKDGEKNGRDLTEECVELRKNYLALAETHERELSHSKKLREDLLALTQAQDALRRQLEELPQSVHSGAQDQLDRVLVLVSRLSQSTVRLLGNQEEIMDILKNMKNGYEEQRQKAAALGKEHLENKRTVHNTQEKLSEQSVALLISRNQVKELEEENSKLQLKIKELNEKFRRRLIGYMQDVAACAGGLGENPVASDVNELKLFVDKILRDVRSSYRGREEQLASAARSYKKRLQRVTKTHHALLVAYRVQREQILARPEAGLDPGLPDAHFSLEAESEQERRRRLQQDEAGTEAQLWAAPEQVEQTEEVH